MDNSINCISFQSLVCSISKSQPYVWNFNSNGGSFSLSRLHCLVHQVCPSKMAHRSNLAKFGNFYSVSRRNKIAPLPILASLCLMIYKMVPLSVKARGHFVNWIKQTKAVIGRGAIFQFKLKLFCNLHGAKIGYCRLRDHFVNWIKETKTIRGAIL